MKKSKHCPLCNSEMEKELDGYSCRTPKCSFITGVGGVFGSQGDVLVGKESELEAVDTAKQCLRFRAGPVFYDSKDKNEIQSTTKEAMKAVALWISYQESYMKSKLQGDFMMSIETWNALKKYVDQGIKDWKKQLRRLKSNAKR